jgi:uncharacterized protein YjiS (DUF1127 family)
MDLQLARSDVFPIKFNGEFLTSTLAPVLTALSQAESGERLLVQTIVKPLKDTWWHQLRLAWSRRTTRLRSFANPRLWLRDGLKVDSLARIRTKCSSPLFAVTIRISAFSDLDPDAPAHLIQSISARLSDKVRHIAAATQQFNRIDENGFILRPIQSGNSWLRKVRSRSFDRPFRLSSNELAGFFNPPSAGTLPNGPRGLSRKGAAPVDVPRQSDVKEAAIFGHTNHRGNLSPFGIKRIDRQQHMYILGKSGSGKSSLLKLLIQSDIANGLGCAVIDPDGSLVDDVLKMVPRHRATDVVIFDPSEGSFVPGFNPFEATRPHLQTRTIESLIDVLRRLLKTEWCERTERIVRYALLAIIDLPGVNILSLRRMLTDAEFRRAAIQRVSGDNIKRFWLRDFPARHDQFASGPIARIVTRLDDLLAVPCIRATLTQEANLLNFREMMDCRKIVLAKVSREKLGQEGVNVLGSLLVWKMYEAAISRTEVSAEIRQPFNLYIDDFDYFAHESFCEILNESRKHLLSLTLAHQHLDQIPKELQSSIFGNVGNFLTFCVGAPDAATVARELTPQFDSNDVVNLPIREFYIKMCIDGKAQQAFSGRTLNLNELPSSEQCVDEILKLSRARYYIRPTNPGCVRSIIPQMPHDARRQPIPTRALHEAA